MAAVTPLPRPEDADAPQLRIAPHNMEAEQALLGALLLDNRALEKVGDLIRAEHFYAPAHGRIYQAIATVVDRGQAATPITLKDYFAGDADLAGVGGPAYLTELAAGVVSLASTRDYAQAVYDLALRRAVIGVGTDMVEEARTHDLDRPVTATIEAAEAALFHIAEQGQTGQGFVTLRDSVLTAIQLAERAYTTDGHVTGVTTGLIDLDKKLGGLQKSDLVILAGRPGMGKAQPLDAQIRTPDGWRAMGDLKPGDALSSLDGAPCAVAGVYPQGTRDIFRVTFSDGRSTRCCAEHLWRVHHRTWPAPRILTTEKVAQMLTRVRYRKRLWIDLHDGQDGARGAALPIAPYALGALLGDGTLSGTTPRFSCAQPEILERLGRALGPDFALTPAGGVDYRIIQAAGRTRKGHQGTVPSPLTLALKDMGLWGLDAERKFIPPPYMAASRAQRLDVLRGLLDTDGWVERFGALRFSSASPQLAADVVALARSLGAIATLRPKATRYTYRGQTREGRTAYSVNIQHPDPAMFVTLPAKRARLRPRAPRRLTFAAIEPCGRAPVQCIAVTHPSRLYITDGDIVTHNTALATNIAFAAAQAYASSGGKEGAPVGFFSLEMSADQLATRILADQSGVSGDSIRRGAIRADDFRAFVEASQKMTAVPLFIDDTPALSIGAVRTRARRLKRQHGLGLLVIDYLQLLTGTGSRQGLDNRVQEIAEITRGLKAIAKELEIPVLALSQLSRQVEAREDKRPQLSDLRESGTIEQDADVVMFIYREEYYLARAMPEEGTDKHMKWQERMGAVHNMAETIVAKQRHGPVGTVKLFFDANLTRFSDLEQVRG
jgi:replicative DNA helicase